MEITTQEFSLLYGGSREATVILRGGEPIYQNSAVQTLLGELPLSMVLSALPADIGESYVYSLELYGHALELVSQPFGKGQLLRLHAAETSALMHPALVTELRNLLFSQQLTLERLLGTLSEQDNDLYGSSARRSFFGLLNYTERIGDMSQLAAGGLVVFPQLISLTQLYRDTISALKLVLPKKYACPVLIAEEECIVNADPTRMEELLLILLCNALQHCPADGSIRVRLSTERERVLLSVEDSGSGMDSDTVSELFEPSVSFLQRGRLSLGLSLARGIAQAHKGSLLLHSRSGAGTRVLVSLPAVKEPDLPVAECIPPEGMRTIQRVMVNILGLDAYREVFDD